jgi:hypothetical protein
LVDPYELLPIAGKLLLMIDDAPRCKCGENCETRQYMTEKFTELKVREDRLHEP